MTTRKLILLAAIAVLATSMAMAEGEGGYIGAGYMQAYTKAKDSSVNINLDGDASGWKAFGGYNFIKFFGIEASYNDFGTVDDTVNNVKFSSEATSWNIMAVGHLPVAFLDIFAKVGYAYVDSTAKAAGSSADDSNWDFMWGGGVGFNLGSKIELRAEYEQYDFNPSYNNVEPNSDLYTLSASFIWKF